MVFNPWVVSDSHTVVCKLIDSPQKKHKKLRFFNLFPFQSNNNYFWLEIRPPLSVINSKTRFGIDSTSFSQFWVISRLQYHTSIIASISLVSDVPSLFNSRIFTILHKFSIGFREGEFPGQSRTLMGSLTLMTVKRSFAVQFCCCMVANLLT